MVPPYLIAAVVYGTLFALMAMGLTLTYMTTKVPNFAYGSFVTIGLYTAYDLFKLNGVGPYEAALVAFLVSGAASILMYLGVLRPLARRGTPLVALMIATFGIDIGFIGIFGIYTDYLQSRYGLIDAKQFFQLPADFQLFGVQGVVIVAPLVLAAITLLLFLLFTRTKFGVAMRASVENPSLARVLGIDVERVYTVSWMLGGGFAGLAGALYTLWLPGGTSTGSDLIVEIFASSILGGLTSIFGAVLGGLVIGSSEDIVTVTLAQGFGWVGTGIIVAILVVAGFFLFREKQQGRRIFGVVLAVVGAYIAFEMISGFSTDLFAFGLVNGFGTNVTPFQKGIPLLIMVMSLLVLPRGLVSLNLRRRK
ncbi:MAG: branched-chain amino acid ABC transporter permease [Nitrososphaerales archaeon]|nr:branched-chain amino acid ABC transporter permease [Nitrososphaerales archaeon]